MSKEECILSAICKHTGIKTIDYNDAIVNLWMTFDPSPALNVIKKGMDEYAKAQSLAFSDWKELNTEKTVGYKENKLRIYYVGPERKASGPYTDEQLYDIFIQKTTDVK